jgi:tetratricopeptide (TPR) repeat protein/outer membrane protein OmpA-like peptidoglycan-associated protein
MSKIKFLFLFIAFAVLSGLQAQSKKAFLAEAEKAFAEKNYHGALVYFEEALAFDKTDAAIMYKTAESARMYNAYGYAASKYHTLLDTIKSNQYPEAVFRLGEMYHKLGMYDKASMYYNQYLSEYANDNQQLTGESRKNIAAVNKAKSLSQNPDPNFKVDLMGEDINTIDADFAASDNRGTMYFSSMRFESKSKNLQYKQLAKTLMKKSEMSAELIGLNTIHADKSVANFAFNDAGNKVYYSICDYVNGWTQSCEIYVSDIDQNGNLTNETKIGEAVNQTGSSNTQPYPGTHLTSGKEGLYFVSDRAGGSGGRDIWFSAMENNSYSTATPVKEINTDKDEITPFYHKASTTLYFSSEGREGYGGMDVYSIPSNSTDITLLPSPVNTSMNDMYYYVNPDGTQGYLTSNRAGFYNQFASYEACCMDIYTVKIDNKIELDVYTLLYPDGTDLTGTTICLYDEDTGKLIQCLTNTDLENKKSFILAPNKNYKITAKKDGYTTAMERFKTNSTDKKLVKKLYLEPEKIRLEVFTFDENTRKELIGTTVTLTDLTDGSVKEIVITNSTSNDFKFDVVKGRQYKLTASKPGYSSVSETFSTNNATGVIRKNLYLPSMLPLSLYFDNDYPNPRSNSPSTKLLYIPLASDYLTKEGEYISNYTQPLSGAEKESATKDLNMFFLNDVNRSRERLTEVCRYLQSSLESGEKVELEIKGYASPRAKTGYNKTLSKRRIKSVVNELVSYNNGVLKTYLKNKSLFFKDVSYGEDEAKPGLSDNLDDRRNSVYYLGAAKERRVELLRINIK